MELAVNKLTESQIINSYNLARGCDIVFSEIISVENYKKLKNKNHFIISQDDSHVFYKSSLLKISNGDIVFSNLDLVEALFTKLKKTNLENIILVTSQTDRKIDSNLYSKKPKNISKWFSINIDIEREDLIPIPYGLANSYSPKNLFKTDFKNLKNKEKINSVYLNFEVNTNYFHRNKLRKKLSLKDNFFQEIKKLSLTDYLEKLNSYKYILCPWGNGFDTHRLWESLYAGSIAVVPEHITFKTTENLPVIRFQNIEELDINFIYEKQKKLKYDYDILNIDFWLRKIRENKNLKNITYYELVHFDDLEEFNDYKKMKNIENRKKMYQTVLRKIHSKLTKTENKIYKDDNKYTD